MISERRRGTPVDSHASRSQDGAPRWRVVSLLFGPEGIWIAISLAVYLFAARNEPSTPAGNDFLETLWLMIPLGGIPLTFLMASVQGGGGWWWLL